MSNLLYYLRRCMPDSIATWAMRNARLRRLLKSLLVSKNSRMDFPIEDGCVIRLHPSIHRDLWFHDYENQNIKVLRQLIREGDTVWDVGANIGFYTVLFAKWVGVQGQVVAFEPDSENFSYLTENCSINRFDDRVVRVNAAVGCQSGFAQLMGSESFTYHLGTEESQVESGRVVRTIALDDFISGQDARIPSLVKIDVEGHEGEVLEGMQQLLAPHNISVFIELHGQDPARKCSTVLSNVGYAMFDPRSGKRTDVSGSPPHFILCKRAT